MSDVVDRFMRYVRIDSPSDQSNFDVTPSTECQFDMARQVAGELVGIGCPDVEVDDHAYVTATVPASAGAEDMPTLGLCAHVDVTPDAPGRGVRPHVVHYGGGTLHIGTDAQGRAVSTSPDETPGLESYAGQDIICADGRTLLGADDKAAVAEIVSLAARLMAHPERPRPRLRLALVPDEEIGHGARLLDLGRFGATWCYTVDGERTGKLDYECFNASMVDVTVRGLMVHPGVAKDVMLNASTVLEEFDALLPKDQRPEHTEGYEGFFHMMSFRGDPSEAQARYIVRDYDRRRFDERERLMVAAARYLDQRYGEGTVEVSVTEQYRNMAELLADREFLVDNALAAIREAGIDPEVLPVRGGTDGAQLTFRGLPCPNITNGSLNCHGIKELQPVGGLEATVDILERLVARFAVPQGR